MRRRSLPIGLIGLIVIMLAFIVWYGWTTQIAPYQAEQQTRRQQQEAAAKPPSEQEIREDLERNKQLVEQQSKNPPKPANDKPKPAVNPQPSKPDPSREVVEYWWKYTQNGTKK